MSNLAKEAALLMSSLSIYRGILDRTVPKAFFKLLCALDKEPMELAGAWGEFFRVLSERGYAGNFSGCITETALFDENRFSMLAASGRINELSPEALSATKRDIAAIIKISRLTPEQVLLGYERREELGSFEHSLPRWGMGKPCEEFSALRECIDKLVNYYAVNGCGMFARYKAFVWRDGKIEPVVHPDKISMESFTGYELQRELVVNNAKAFLDGVHCNNCLLYGDRGTGKSSTVKAILNEYCKDGLRMVEMPKDRLGDFPILADKIAALPLKFIIFIDDLSFSTDDESYAQLKAVLEGGLAARPDNALIYATSNRRHLIKESYSERSGDDMHRNDTMQETLSLYDRFGLAVNFTAPDKKGYLEIVRALAEENGLNVEAEALEKAAERWALERGGRSPRCARQFISAAQARLRND